MKEGNGDRVAAMESPLDSGRRQLIKGAGIAGAGLALNRLLPTSSAESADTSLAPLPMTNTSTDEVPRKPLGRTGVQVSAIGIGGATLGQAKTVNEAIRIVHEAVDAGINFMDNAWEYNEHKSEEWMGQALQGRRDKVFLMTKVCTHGRDKQVAMQQLEESLQRLERTILIFGRFTRSSTTTTLSCISPEVEL